MTLPLCLRVASDWEVVATLSAGTAACREVVALRTWSARDTSHDLNYQHRKCMRRATFIRLNIYHQWLHLLCAWRDRL